MSRNGIICAGNWIVDIVQFVEQWPEQGELTNIHREVIGLGGCSANLSLDFARMDPNLKILPIGCIGDDTYADIILKQCRAAKINTQYLHVLPGVATSHTQVIQVQAGGQRTFFHYKGANAVFGPEHIPLQQLQDYKIFHLGYLLLLDKLDELHNDKTAAAHLLQQAQTLGFITTVDIVSENSKRFSTLIPPTLPFIDYLIINELEAGRILNINPRDQAGKLDETKLASIAEGLLNGGAKNIVIHAPEGAFWRNQHDSVWVKNPLLPSSKIVSSVGAGDAFCAGILYGIHQNLDIKTSIHLAQATAKACLFGYTASDNIPTAVSILGGLS